MPLPVPIQYVAEDSTIRDVAVKQGKSSGYEPTPEYHPTMKAVKCATCKGVGIAEFVNGFNLKDGDRLMNGQSIRGVCFRCNKETELIPIPMDQGLGVLYRAMRTLAKMSEQGQSMPANGIIWPHELIEERERMEADVKPAELRGSP